MAGRIHQPPTVHPASPFGLTERDRVIIQDHTDALRADVEARLLEKETVRLRISEVAERLGVTATEVRQYAERAGIALPPPRRGEPEPRLSLRQVRDINLAIDLGMVNRATPRSRTGSPTKPAASSGVMKQPR